MLRKLFISLLVIFMFLKGYTQIGNECRQKIDSMSNVVISLVLRNDGMAPKTVLGEVVPFEQNSKGSIYTDKKAMWVV